MKVKEFLKEIKDNINFYTKKEINELINEVRNIEDWNELNKDYVIMELKKLRETKI